MPNRIMRASSLLTGCFLLAVAPLTAQEKAAPKVLERTTSSEAAKAALTAALVEVENFGGAHRVDAKLKALLDADESFALGRAYYGGWASGLSAAERQTELTRALKDAADASTAELLLIAAFRESRAGRNAQARELADVVRKLAPDDPHAAWFRMLVSASAAEALRIGEEAAKQFPDYAPVLNMLAYRLNTAGRKDEAFQTIQKYLALEPDHPNPHDSYAELLQLNGRLDEAAAHYAHALEKDPRFEGAHEGMAEIEVMRGNYAAARAHLEQAIKDAATPARALVLQREIAATFLYENNLKDAQRVMHNVVQQAEQNAMNAQNDKRTIALMALLDGKRQEATQLYAAAAPANPGPILPLTDAIFYTLLKQPAEVHKAAAAMAANAAAAPDANDTQQAAAAARVLDALARNDLQGARAAHAQVTTVGYKALTAAFLMPAVKKAGDKTTAQALQADIDAFKAVNFNAGFVRVMAGRK